MTDELIFRGIVLDASSSNDFEKESGWRALLDLTYAVWRVMDVAVDNEFLKNKVKHAAAEILAEYPCAIADEAASRVLAERIRSQRALLSLAQRVSGSREINFLVLKNEYRKVEAFLTERQPRERQLPAPIPEKTAPAAPLSSLTGRQQKIMQFFSKRRDEQIRLKDVMQIFQGLTDRTVRSDLKELCVKKLVMRSNGHGQASFYRIAKGIE